MLSIQSIFAANQFHLLPSFALPKRHFNTQIINLSISSSKFTNYGLLMWRLQKAHLQDLNILYIIPSCTFEESQHNDECYALFEFKILVNLYLKRRKCDSQEIAIQAKPWFTTTIISKLYPNFISLPIYKTPLLYIPENHTNQQSKRLCAHGKCVPVVLILRTMNLFGFPTAKTWWSGSASSFVYLLSQFIGYYGMLYLAMSLSNRVSQLGVNYSLGNCCPAMLLSNLEKRGRCQLPTSDCSSGTTTLVSYSFSLRGNL